MTLTQIATLLNNTIIPNMFGDGESGGSAITITEDLRNVVDIGTALSSMTADQVKNYMQDLCVGVFDTYVDTRSYKDESYGLFVSDIEYGGALQRVKSKLLAASDTNILTLENAYTALSPTDYMDGKYYGVELDSKIYSIDTGFKVKYSLSTQMFKKSFTSASGVQKLIALIESTVDNSIRLEVNSMARAVIRKLILSAYTGGRKIQLITAYNTKMGLTSSDPGYITLANWSQSVTFKLFCQTVMSELRKYITDYNEKYNDGTVPTFTPESDSRCILLTEFATELDVALGSVYHKEMVEGTGEYRTLNFWQNSTPDLLPTIASGRLHDQIVERVKDAGVGVLDDVVTIDHVVGILYDRFSAFETVKLDKVSSQYVGSEDFTTYFHHMIKSYSIDPRNTAVILLLS
ncbi:MAG: hypothetical protein IIZ41_06910 [Lachnospiraceae bacterium]|nr:hypothetical protein [Lachnospiraceae bacterium]